MVNLQVTQVLSPVLFSFRKLNGRFEKKHRPVWRLINITYLQIYNGGIFCQKYQTVKLMSRGLLYDDIIYLNQYVSTMKIIHPSLLPLLKWGNIQPNANFSLKCGNGSNFGLSSYYTTNIVMFAR